MKRIIYSIFLCFVFVSGPSAPAQNVIIDPTFNPTDQGFGFGDGANSRIRTIAIQSDGKIIIAGNFTSYNGTARNRIARLNADGSLDVTFNPGAGANFNVYTTAIQSNGKIIIGGDFTSYNGTLRNSIARINADGTLDASFNPGTGTSNPFTGLTFTVRTTAIQSDGQIIIGGDFTYYNGMTRSRIARLNADGTLDPSLTGAPGNVYSTAIQSDGKILIGGDFLGNSRILRLNGNGTLDGTFNPGGTGANNFVNSIAIQNDQKIIIGGSFSSYNGTTRFDMARLNADGTLDTSFNPGLGSNSVLATSIQSDGKIMVGGTFTSYNGLAINRIVRINSDGTLDGSFNPGSGANNFVHTTAIQSDGKIIIGGDFTSYNSTGRKYIVRLNADGTLDASFNSGTGANGTAVFTTALQSDGKIIIGGDFISYNGMARNSIARLHANGALDGSFTVGAGANSTVRSTPTQSDGKIIIGGDFSFYNGTVRNRIARLNDDGTLDVSFNPGTGANNTISTTAIQSDGKIIISGEFTTFNGTARNRIARLNSDGSLDGSFTEGTGANGNVRTTAIQSDGKIIIGGSFTSYNSTTRNHIARINTDGTLDTSFDPGTGATSVVYTTEIQSDGKIIIGGEFTSYNGTIRNRLARLNADGTLDVSFNQGTGSNGIVLAIDIQSDGKIIIGGDFSSYNGMVRNRIARLNADGTMDVSFNPGTGANGLVWTTTLQSDGKIIIGGQFTSYNATGRNRVTRIEECSPPGITGTTTASRCGVGAVTLGATASAGTLNWYAASSGGSSLGTGPSFTTPSISISTTYYVDATSGGCTSIRTEVIATVNSIPTVATTTPASRCDAGTVILGATASAGTLNWYAASTGGASLGTGTTFTTQSISVTTTFHVDATNNGCSSSRSAVIATVNSTPSVATTTPASRCDAGTVTLGATASEGTLNWYAASTGGASLGTGTSFTTPSITATTTYYADATSNGCISSRTAVIATVIPAPPQPTVLANNSNPSSVILTSSSATGNQWFKDGVAINGGTGNTLTLSQPGTYGVQVTLSGCASPMSAGHVYVITGLESQPHAAQLYPNPSVDHITFSLFDFEKDKPVSIIIMDTQGRIMVMTSGLGHREISIDVHHYAPGKYFALLRQTNKSLTKQFIKSEK